METYCRAMGRGRMPAGGMGHVFGRGRYAGTGQTGGYPCLACLEILSACRECGRGAQLATSTAAEIFGGRNLAERVGVHVQAEVKWIINLIIIRLET